MRIEVETRRCGAGSNTTTNNTAVQWAAGNCEYAPASGDLTSPRRRARGRDHPRVVSATRTAGRWFR